MEIKSPAAQLLDWARNVSVAWQIFVFFFPAAGALVTGWVARAQEIPVPWYLVLFYSFGVFMFASVAAVALMRAAWEFTLKHKLTCDDFTVQIIPTSQNKVTVVIQSFFNNLSHVPMQVMLSDISISVQSKTTPAPPESTILRSIAASLFVPMVWPAIRDVDIRSVATGFLRFTAKYGAAGKRQNRILKEKFVLSINVEKTRDGYFPHYLIGSELQEYL